MKPSHSRTILAGLAGGLTMNGILHFAQRLLTWVGWRADLFPDPSHLGTKLVYLDPKMAQVPIIVRGPGNLVLQIVVFGVIHAYIYRWLSPGWPQGIGRRALCFAWLSFLMSFLFWRAFEPYAQIGRVVWESLGELGYWALIGWMEGLAIAAVMERGAAQPQTGAPLPRP